MTAIDEIVASSADCETGGPALVRPAIREPQFVRYLAGQSVSQLGNMVWYVALSWSAVTTSAWTFSRSRLPSSTAIRAGINGLVGNLSDEIRSGFLVSVDHHDQKIAILFCTANALKNLALIERIHLVAESGLVPNSVPRPEEIKFVGSQWIHEFVDRR